jgi:ABC-type Fe3+ transport system permease subunit
VRRSAWIIPAAAIVIWLMCVGWPAVASIEHVLVGEARGVSVSGGGELLLVSALWALAAAVGAVILGWGPGRLLGTILARAKPQAAALSVAALLLVPIMLPAYVIFFAWWQAWAPDAPGAPVFRWAVEHGQVMTLRYATLLAGLWCWSWPIVAWCVAGAAAARPRERDEMLLLDGVGPIGRTLDRLRTDARGLMVGGLIVFLAAFSNTVIFDLAEIFTFGNELRAIAALGATPRDVMTAAVPAMLLTAIAACAVWVLLSGGRSQMAVRTSPAHRATGIFTGMVWLVSVLVPLGLMAANIRAVGGQIDEFITFYGRGLVNGLVLGLVCGAIGAVIAVGLMWMWQDRRAWVRGLAHVQALGWIITAAVPGTMVGTALTAAYNRKYGGLDDVIYLQPAVLVLGYLARFGIIAALLARWAAMSEPSSLRDLRTLDGAETFWPLLRATWPRSLAAGGASFALVLVLSLSEIPVTAQVRPPGFDVITPSILNDMHFQRPHTVMIATGAFVGLAIAAAAGVFVVWRPVRAIGRATPQAAVALLVMLCVAGCGGVDAENAPPLRPRMIFGAAGAALGQFHTPRALAVDFERGHLYVVDRSARIQRWGLNGEPQLSWQMPEWNLGKPVGVSVAPDGRVLVADTHYFRVVIFDPDGNELMRFGEFGEGPGQFIYTTHVAVGPQGRIYVAEYGGNDRIQVFDPDGTYLFEFGSFGSEPGQLNRPQTILFNREMTELYIADACNHRIVVVDPQGNLLRIIGRPGRGHGELGYPYDLMLLRDGSILVVENHNARIQKFGPDGQPRGVWGRLGFREGELRFPWGIDGNDEVTFVLDTGNSRVQVVRTP